MSDVHDDMEPGVKGGDVDCQGGRSTVACHDGSMASLADDVGATLGMDTEI
jgi:hypothetical protein